MRQAQEAPNAEVRIICDLYNGHVERARQRCTNPKVRVVHEWEKAVADPDIDVVLIATPDFWHAPMTIAAAESKKEIYVEKGWCTSLADAKKMRKAVKESGVTMQLGHHYNGLPTYHRAREIYRSGQLGKVSLVRTFTDRSAPFPFWKFYGDYGVSEMPKDAGPNTIDWERFVARAPKRPFDAERFFTWRCYWDYGTGIAGRPDEPSLGWREHHYGNGHPGNGHDSGRPLLLENRQRGARYLERGLRLSTAEISPSRSDAPLHSNHVGETTQLLGRDKTLEVNQNLFCRTYPAEWTPAYRAKTPRPARHSRSAAPF